MTYQLFKSLAAVLCVSFFVISCDSSNQDADVGDTETVPKEGDSETENGGTDGTQQTDFDGTDDTDTIVKEVILPEDQKLLLAKIDEEYKASIAMSATELVTQYPAQTNTALDYNPAQAHNLDLIQSSTFSLTDSELGKLGSNGFVVSKQSNASSFYYGYANIYKEDLPVYISADAILDSVHRSFDSILMNLEEQVLFSKLDTLLGNVRVALAGDTALGDAVKTDLDFYLTVAHSLLLDEVQTATFASAEDVMSFYNLAKAADGMTDIDLFDAPRKIDFSQFIPRGHYTDSPALTAYFKSMMWLGRIDFRMVETLENGAQVVNRPQLHAVLALEGLMVNHLELWKQINLVIELFVGKSDNMTPLQTEGLMAALGIGSAGDLDSLGDEEIKQIILQNGFGAQRIASHLMVNGLGAGTMPLNASFLIFGQRFVVDSYVFSNVVYDRVQGGNEKRMMPNPLDVAFSVLNNNHAAQLLQPELLQYQYAPDLHMMRTVVSTYDEDFWSQNLYNHWLQSLAALSDSTASNMPSYTQTAQWENRLLNTQLGSWAELRHDTLLYTKQSYTMGITCEFPDAYVDPYPAFFSRLVAYADKGLEVAGTLAENESSPLLKQALDYFTELGFVCDILGEMAQQQLDKVPYTEAQLGFINEGIQISESNICGGPPTPEGWYKRLFFDLDSALEYDPTIADVHTQPTDAAGATVGKVLHVATGRPDAMIVTVNQCDGPRAYAGMVFSYYEKVTQDFHRMTDEEWYSEPDYAIYPDAAPEGYVPPRDIPWQSELFAQ